MVTGFRPVGKFAGTSAALVLALLAGPLEAEQQAPPVLAPSEIVAAAPKSDWLGIADSDILVMDLAPDAKGKSRRVVIQLMPAPFSQGWVGNIRKLAAARFWDGLSVNRVQDNYVVQWGDAEGKDKAKARKLPDGLAVMEERDYLIPKMDPVKPNADYWHSVRGLPWRTVAATIYQSQRIAKILDGRSSDVGKEATGIRAIPIAGWPVATDGNSFWPIHCYGMVGVGRNLSPDTGSGAELYAVIGHAPRHLDRNIALVGRVIEGGENLSSLPRGTGALGFYETAAERVPIISVRMGNEVTGLPAYEYLSTESESFARYADARANRRDAFFIRPAGGADVCNIPVPVRRSTGSR